MTITYHDNWVQGSDEWKQARCGLLTASEMKLIVTPTLKVASNDKERSHLDELAAQRVNQFVEASYISDAMLRGKDDEIDARITYEEKYAPVKECGFITNDKWGFILGYSPDGLVGDDGTIEVKSRIQKYQFRTIVDKAMPDDYRIQVQTGLLVSERKWCDFISYCGGMDMITLRVEADPIVQEAIIVAATVFHEKLDLALKAYADVKADKSNRLVPTERRVELEMHL